MVAYLHKDTLYNREGVFDLLIREHGYSKDNATMALFSIGNYFHRNKSIKLIHPITDERLKFTPVKVEFKNDYPFKV